EIWVVEGELLSLLQQQPQTWLSTRLVPVDPELVTALTWGDGLALGRSDDGFWRVLSGARPALLSNEAVEVRLRRLLRAKLDPFIDPDAVADSLTPWVSVKTLDGNLKTLHVGGTCPGHPERRLVSRGPGRLGCVQANLLEPWPLHDPDAGMIESRLVPHDYGRIVGIELERPDARRLVRRGGEWFYAESDAGLVPVAEAEVRRWYQALGRLEVALADGEELPAGEGQGEGGEPSQPPSFEPDWTLAVLADTKEALRVSCRLAADPVLCVRDDGLLLRVLGEVPRNLVFDVETFAERRLTNIGPSEVRQLEILPPLDDPRSTTVRQSVHAELGAWELDDPDDHPDDSGAIDLDRLETVLWAVRQLRAEAWVEPPTTPPLRRLRVEVVPAQGLLHSVEIELFPECVVAVEEHPPAAISTAHCQALAHDLLFDDPLRFWLERSRSVELSDAAGNHQVLLRRRDQQFVHDDGRSITDDALADRLTAWIDWRSAGLRRGEPPSAARWILDIHRDIGPDAKVEIGDGWARVKGADWYYLQRDPDAAPSNVAPEDLPLDVGAVELD
ncbi:MAG TPA: hypothetical protein VK034_26805, partial [Enhygromyxa sp.]|nr:hypothetical protein [Enhygromyxa sp.]